MRIRPNSRKPPTHRSDILMWKSGIRLKEEFHNMENTGKKPVSTHRHSLLVLGYAGRRASWEKGKERKGKLKIDEKKIPSSATVHQLRAREPQWSLLNMVLSTEEDKMRPAIGWEKDLLFTASAGLTPSWVSAAGSLLQPSALKAAPTHSTLTPAKPGAPGGGSRLTVSSLLRDRKLRLFALKWRCSQGMSIANWFF